jgi:1-deoxy-D-xylulose-5-phosphate synthase
MSVGDAVCALRTHTDVSILGLPTKFIPHDPKSNVILSRFGLDVDGLVTTIRNG